MDVTVEVVVDVVVTVVDELCCKLLVVVDVVEVVGGGVTVVDKDSLHEFKNNVFDTSNGMMRTMRNEKYQATRTARVTRTGCRIQFEYLNRTWFIFIIII